MPEVVESGGRQVATKAAGVLQFFLGAVFSQALFGLAVGVPALVALRVFGGDNRGVLSVILVASAIGVVSCASLAAFIGRRTAASWPLIVGAEMQPLWVIYSSLFGPLSSSGLTVFAVPWLISGAALALVYWRERRKRDAISSSSVCDPVSASSV